MERRAEIYVTRRLAARLRQVLTFYPQAIDHTVEDQFGYRTVVQRTMLVEDLVEQTLNAVIEEKYPLVLEYEKRIDKLEKELIQRAETDGQAG